MDRRQRWRRRTPIICGLAVIALMVVAVIWLIRSFMQAQQREPERVVQNITLIRPPPPPPAPPPPPPEKLEQQKIVQKVPDPTPDNTPAPQPQQLGLDANGTAGSDAFGLVARQGGADLIGTGGAVFAWYTNKVKDAVSNRLAADDRLHAKQFTVDIRVWISADGSIKQVRLASSSGNNTIDGEISRALDSMRPIDEAPPIEMPQPITLEIVGRT